MPFPKPALLACVGRANPEGSGAEFVVDVSAAKPLRLDDVSYRGYWDAEEEKLAARASKLEECLSSLILLSLNPLKGRGSSKDGGLPRGRKKSPEKVHCGYFGR